jgi:hypothetical protein
VNDIIPPPPTPKDVPSKGIDPGFDYKALLERAKTTEADWERNIEYQKNGSWEGKMTGNIKKALEEMEKEKKAEGRVARSEAGGSRQDNYWSSIYSQIKGQSEKDKTGDPGDSVQSGHRADELNGMGLIEKKNHIINATKEEVNKGNLTGDLKGIGAVKVGGTTERFAGGYSINLKVTVGPDSKAGRAMIEHYRQLGDLYRKGNPADNPNYKSDVERLRKAWQASPEYAEISKLEQRVSLVYRQFNYTRMNSLDDGFGTNFYGRPSVRFKGADGSEWDSNGSQWKLPK